MNTSGVSVTLTVTSDPLGLLDAAKACKECCAHACGARPLPSSIACPQRGHAVAEPAENGFLLFISSSVEAITAAYTARGLVSRNSADDQFWRSVTENGFQKMHVTGPTHGPDPDTEHDTQP